jgi:electron transfer flavoprotein beta subunit
VSKIEITKGKLVAERLVEEGYQQVTARLPCMCAVLKEIAQPRLPTLKGKIRSMEAVIPECTTKNMDLEPGCLGLKGSPTHVVKIESPKVMRNGRTITVTDDTSCGEACDAIMAVLEDKGALE